jgi:hypothetical protein
VFGLSTLDSAQVEQMKDEYRELRDVAERSPDDDARLKTLTSELEDLPDWSQGIEGQDELKDLLRDIKSELSER